MPPHIGHAYEAIATDAIARFERLDGKDVFFLTGTDEHGLKMKQTAAKEGMTPRELADRNSARFREMAGRSNLSNDDFIRTTEPRHYQASEEIWRRMQTAKRRHLPEEVRRLVLRARRGVLQRERDDARRRTACVAARRARRSSGRRRRRIFFRLSAYQDKLLAHYEKNPDFILPPERRNEVVSFVRGGLEDLSISRTTLDWGIPVPRRADGSTSCTCGSTR